MPTDYAPGKARQRQKKPPSESAPRRGKSSARGRLGGFSPISFGAGGVCGAVAVLAIVYGPPLMPPPTVAVPDAGPLTESTEPVVSYEFIHRLPNEQVVVDVAPYDRPPGEPAPREYLLQAASFSNRDHADAMRAELILEGLDVAINSVPSNSGGIWHQVLVGPFANRVDMERTLTRLRARDIPALVLERTPSG